MGLGSGFQAHEKRVWIIGAVIGIAVAFIVGILIGRYATCPDHKEQTRPGPLLPSVSEKLMRDADADIVNEVIDAVSADYIRDNLR